MTAVRFWRRLYTPGHDAMSLTPDGAGWRLEGRAVFRDESGPPAAVTYRVDLAPDWTTRAGSVTGFLGETAIHHEMTRGADGWRLDGVEQPDVRGLVDLDFGFTPATNYNHLRREGLAVGEARDIPVAWFDLGTGVLSVLPQSYERRTASDYAYHAPSVDFGGTIILDPDGFVRRYADLWAVEG
jgi:hypothetical protein